MPETARLELDGKVYELPTFVGSEGERAIDIAKLRDITGYITLDDGYGNTGSCRSAITYIDGDAGILRYRGIPIEDIAGRSSFVETAWLVIFGELPNVEQRDHFAGLLSESAMIDEVMRKHFNAFPQTAPPMAILSAMINTLSAHDAGVTDIRDDADMERAAAVLISKVRTIAAAAYKASIGEPLVYPRYDLKYAENFLHMMFSVPYRQYEATPEVAAALNLFLMLHADHEQNCSTSTVRMVGSSGANLYLSVAAGVSALSGPLHGGANQAVIEMLQQMRDTGESVATFVQKVKDKKSGVKLMGFGHRIYKNFDPRAQIVKRHADAILRERPGHDELLDLALALEEAARSDDYFTERKLYPNVDFYTGLIYQAMGFPSNMFTVLFTIGRLPGWIAHWREQSLDPATKIGRPRQVYTGVVQRDYVPSDQR